MPSLDGKHFAKISNGVNPQLNLALRTCTNQRELYEIRFEYDIAKDTAAGIAQELLEAQLISAVDLEIMTLNIQQLLDQRNSIKSIQFQLIAGLRLGDIESDNASSGFAELIIKD